MEDPCSWTSGLGRMFAQLSRPRDKSVWAAAIARLASSILSSSVISRDFAVNKT
ncbi:uncharacterized protein MYCGRDRAFT_106706 [Zymoseptoria tritici IPO323]|uniref:Uncharacterized protein n=1 Tax=Zymoseptoria tritici (strain CBS 115943 / IPO323) TaxID=336722 RepID=F9XS98_ZYMTI|nr:uncharacterized protein MYCGRDRAFT_106706 [Zymoseptoria tritici IPO323]EGP81875.1 hypothetical protein MYCGRDRAFT_106706 [Zymoseptoria tritici IPO323]